MNTTPLAQQAKQLWQQQLDNWPLARRSHEGLKAVKVREFTFSHTRVLVQFNPSRMVSTVAATDAKAIAQRPCFLCDHNRPAEQCEVDAGEYWLLVNPFPVFPIHFTIPHKQHVPQQILPYFADFLSFARQLVDFVVFYNGPNSGASAPDHLHFQAGNKGILPLIEDYYAYDKTKLIILHADDNSRLLRMKGLMRKIYVIESSSIEAAVSLFDELYHSFPVEIGHEPMMNVVGLFENGKWTIFVLPRAEFRPWQFFAPEPKQLLISPAAIEMAGILITPLEAHFQRLASADIVDIFNQISPDDPQD